MLIVNISNKFFSWRYELGSLFLVFLNILVSFEQGSFLGLEGSELFGHTIGTLFIVLIVVGISRLIRSARTRSATTKIVFFSLIVVLFLSLIQGKAKLLSISTELDKESLNIEEGQAKALAQYIQDSVSKREMEKVKTLLDRDRFMKKVLRGHDTTSRYLRDVAKGASKSFKKGNFLEQISSFLNQGGNFTFVKMYRRHKEPILQFRLTEDSGNLHYFDFYIFKTTDGNIKIDDLQYYHSGELLSRQIIKNLTDLNSEKSRSLLTETIPKVSQLLQQGKFKEGYTILESLPDDLKQKKMIMRLRIQGGYGVDVEQAEKLFNEFKRRFPDDQSIIFSAFTAAIAKNDLEGAVTLINDIYMAVEGDEYLLWFKTKLLLMQKKYKEATELLSEMKNKYNIDVATFAYSKLPEDFLFSKEYKIWSSRH